MCDKSTDVDRPEKLDGKDKSRNSWSPGFNYRWGGHHVCSSHHNHKSKEEVESCNQVREFEQEQEKRLHQEKQKLAEMDKIIEFTEQRQQHLARKNRILQELSENKAESDPRTKMLKDSFHENQAQTSAVLKREKELDLRRPDDFEHVKEALETREQY